MWLYTVQGFYSVVHKPPCKEDELMVRARCVDDIEKLQKLLGEKYKFNGNITHSPKADYAYRMIVPMEIFASFMATTVMELDYDDFKNTLPYNEDLRHDAYFRCWEAMCYWQRGVKKSNSSEKYIADDY